MNVPPTHRRLPRAILAARLALLAFAGSVLAAQAAENPEASRGKSTWKCSADGLAAAEYDGSASAFIRLVRYSRGSMYPVKLNDERTEATGTTGDGTPFKCVLVK